MISIVSFPIDFQFLFYYSLICDIFKGLDTEVHNIIKNKETKQHFDSNADIPAHINSRNIVSSSFWLWKIW